MIRGPVLPQARERLWSLVAGRLDAIECGLELVMESLDCSAGTCGVIDALCRDASGTPVLVALAVDDDTMLLPRIASAAEFLERVGDGLGEAVPEGRFRDGAHPRLVVIGAEASAAAFGRLARLGLPMVELCRLESFRLAGSERLVARWNPIASSLADDGAESGGFGAGDGAPLWENLVGFCERLDPGVRISPGRFRRRITWRGHLLGHVEFVDGTLRGAVDGGDVREIETVSDVRALSDGLMRRFADLAGILHRGATRPAPGPSPANGRKTAPAGRPSPSRREPDRGTLRSAIAESLLSPEEFAALTEPPASGRPNDSPD